MNSSSARIGKIILLPALIMAAFAIIPVGCRRVEDTVYSHFQRIDSRGWDPNDYVTFMPWPADSAETLRDKYNIVLHFRYKSSRVIPPFPITVTLEDDEGSFKSETLHINLFTAHGSPRGTGERGLYLYSDTILKGHTLCPGTLISLQPGVAQEATEGLLDIGLSLHALTQRSSPTLKKRAKKVTQATENTKDSLKNK